MGLAGGPKVGVHAEVDLDLPALEPRAAPLGELGGFRRLGDPEDYTVEPPRLVLAAGGHGGLDVVDAHHAHRGGQWCTAGAVDGVVPPRIRSCRLACGSPPVPERPP